MKWLNYFTFSVQYSLYMVGYAQFPMSNDPGSEFLRFLEFVEKCSLFGYGETVVRRGLTSDRSHFIST